MNKKSILRVLVILVIVGIIAIFSYKTTKEKGYSIVYLSTGEVYVGKLTIFPNFELRDSYLFQATKDPKDESKNNFNLNPTKDALWAPEVLYLVKKNVIFYGPLSKESKIAQTLGELGK